MAQLVRHHADTLQQLKLVQSELAHVGALRMRCGARHQQPSEGEGEGERDAENPENQKDREGARRDACAECRTGLSTERELAELEDRLDTEHVVLDAEIMVLTVSKQHMREEIEGMKSTWEGKWGATWE